MSGYARVARSVVLVCVFAVVALSAAGTTQPRAKTTPSSANWTLAFSLPGSGTGTEEIHVIGSNGAGERALTQHVPTGYVRGWIEAGRLLVIESRSLWTLSSGGGHASRVSPTYDAELSPDGRTVASFDRRGNIVLRTASGRLVRVIRTHLGSDDSLDDPAYPVWSPDGQRLAYYVLRETEAHDSSRIYVVNADGSGSRLLSPGKVPQDSTPAWSPDGKQIAFAVSPSESSLDEDLYVMNADGSGRRQLATHISPLVEAVTWSPRGDALAYARNAGGAYVVSLNGGPARKIAATGKRASVPSWDSSGTKLVFADDGRLVVVGADGRGATTIVRQAGLAWATWAPGRQIAFNSDLGVFAVDPSGKHLRTIAGRISDTSPAWSPDGSRLAFVREGLGAGVYVMNANGSSLRRVAQGDQVAWAPDGRRLVIAEYEQGPIAVLELATGRRYTVGVGEQPAWSPAGNRITYVHNTLQGADPYASQLMLVNADGTGTRKLAERAFFADEVPDYLELYDSPSWSPDGSEVAIDATLINDDPYGEIEGGTLGVVDLTGHSRKLPGGGSWLAWSPSRSEIAYGDSAIGIVQADGSSTRTLVSASGNRTYRDLAWSPDGERFAFSRCTDPGDDATCNVYLVSRDGHALRSLTRGASPSWQPRPH